MCKSQCAMGKAPDQGRMSVRDPFGLCLEVRNCRCYDLGKGDSTERQPTLDKIEITCGKCGTRLKFSEKFIGRQGMCVACGEQFIIRAGKPASEAKKPPAAGPAPGAKVSTKLNFKISTYFRKPPSK